MAHHPLAARVAVNRIWLALFGQGLVRTPSNFGRVGDRPALPELLEFLAARLVEQKYSVKEMIREIVLSEAYQRSSASNPANEKIDSGQSLSLAPEPAAARSGAVARRHARRFRRTRPQRSAANRSRSTPISVAARYTRRPAASSRMKRSRCSICPRPR